MTEVFLDTERLQMHKLYVGRLLFAIGKPSTHANSYASLVDDFIDLAILPAAPRRR